MRSLSDLLRNVVQLGYVTTDIDAAAEYLERTLGTVSCVKSYRSSLGGGTPQPRGEDPRRPWVVVDGVPADEWAIDVALVNAGSTNIEIIRPVGGAVDLYRDAIRAGVPATFHHIGTVVDDLDEATAVVEAAGKTWSQYGDSGAIRFGYVDLRPELGHFVEVMELAPEAVAMFGRLAAASDAVVVP